MSAQTLIAVALAVAVDQEFPEALTYGVITPFIDRLKQRFPQHSDIDTDIVRALPLTVDGQPGPLDPYDRDALISKEYLITYAIIDEQPLNEAQLQEYVTEVIATAEAQA